MADRFQPEEFLTERKMSVEASKKFLVLFQEAVKQADRIYAERAESYNKYTMPPDEWVLGVFGVAGDIYKRATRLTNVLYPWRPVTAADIERALDNCLDLINQSRILWSMLKLFLD